MIVCTKNHTFWNKRLREEPKDLEEEYASKSDDGKKDREKKEVRKLDEMEASM